MKPGRTRTTLRITAAIMLLALMVSGCIHTYPDGNGIDPTLIDTRLEIALDIEWRNYMPEDARTRTVPGFPVGLVVNLYSASGSAVSVEKIFQPGEIKDNYISLPIDKPLRAEEYSMSIWLDYRNPDSHGHLEYDASSIRDIKATYAHGEFSPLHDCLFHEGNLDLRKYAGKIDSKVSVPVILRHPTGRFRIVAEDYQDFLSRNATDINRGITYSVRIDYVSTIPGAFDLAADEPTRPQENVSFSTPLDILTIPGIEMELASDRLFTTSETLHHTIDISVLDSNGNLVSRFSGVRFPLQRGKITNIYGRFLTNGIAGGFMIDTKWEGEEDVYLHKQSN